MGFYRILAIDYGNSKIGFALTDPMRIISQPYYTLIYDSEDSALDWIQNTIRKEQVGRIVMGLPLDMEGRETYQSSLIRKFADKLRTSIEIPIDFQDERFTSEEASAEIRKMGKNPIDGRKIIDQIAASIILRNYLESYR